MKKKSKTLIIIPAHNEEENIGSVIGEIRKHHPLLDIVTVNDGSTDKTKYAAEVAGSKVLTLPFNLGYGVALQTGYKYALESDYQYVVQLDADGQHDPQYIQALLHEVESGAADVSIGSRFLAERAYKVTTVRRLGMLIFGSLASIITKRRISDPTSGYQAINRSVLHFYASDVYPCDYPDADVIILLHFAGFKVKEVPVKMFASKKLKSMHGGFKPVYYIFKMFLSILVTLLREKPDKRKREICQ
ncbi:MAG: glycosyltransferase family 2 protein [Candidatus Omnitrophica bacterium]|nr:glycosyltransferase family 2 protein [Candidatus Omnitrophota bacterium]